MIRHIPWILALLALPAPAAISFSAPALGPYTAGTSITWNHTCAANSVLYVAIWNNNAGPTSVTANGVAMTNVGNTSAAGYLNVFQLLNCSGAQTIVTGQPFSFCAGSSISVTGAAQSSQPNAVATHSGTTTGGSTYSASVTSTVDNAVTLQFIFQSFGAGSIFTAGAGTTVLLGGTGSQQQIPSIAVSSTAISPAENSTQNVVANTAQSVSSVMIAIAPSSASTFVANQSVIAIQ